MIYLELFWSFFQIGLFSIGGGYVYGTLDGCVDTMIYCPHEKSPLDFCWRF